MADPDAHSQCTRYVALLRGINVGGANKLDMAHLRRTFEGAGMHEVSTYINSGNVLFSTEWSDREQLERSLEQAVQQAAGAKIDIQLRDAAQIASIVGAMPADWVNDASMKCDVVFLRPDVDRPGVIDDLAPREGIEDAVYVPGAIIWRVDRKDATRSRLTRMVGTPLYALVTVRNCNTVRALHERLTG